MSFTTLYMLYYHLFFILSILFEKNVVKYFCKLFFDKIYKEVIMNFNKDTLIGEILEKAPEKADVLLEVGMHCLSCPASQAETLEEACEVHSIDVEEVLAKLNENK